MTVFNSVVSGPTRGFHDDEPCHGCKQTIDGLVLNSRGFHSRCEPCHKCKQTIPGLVLNSRRFHEDCPHTGQISKNDDDSDEIYRGRLVISEGK